MIGNFVEKAIFRFEGRVASERRGLLRIEIPTQHCRNQKVKEVGASKDACIFMRIKVYFASFKISSTSFVEDFTGNGLMNLYSIL